MTGYGLGTFEQHRSEPLYSATSTVGFLVPESKNIQDITPRLKLFNFYASLSCSSNFFDKVLQKTEGLYSLDQLKKSITITAQEPIITIYTKAQNEKDCLNLSEVSVPAFIELCNELNLGGKLAIIDKPQTAVKEKNISPPISSPDF